MDQYLRLSDREYSIVHGVGFVIGITLLLAFLPTVLLVDPEFLVSGLFAGFVLGSPFEGFLRSTIGGGSVGSRMNWSRRGTGPFSGRIPGGRRG